jgi:arabinoxylan arabinofuranohydrolase
MMTDDPMDLPAAKYAGVAFQNQGTFFGAGNGGNNHSDMFTYKGETYFTYHAQTRGAAWAAALGTPGATQGYRSVHIDKLEFNADGTIKPITGTRAGVEQVEAFDPYRTFEAETLAWQLGIGTAKTDVPSAEFPEHNGNGNMVLSRIDDGDFAGLSGVDFGSGATSVSAEVKPLVEGGSIQVRLDDADGQVVAEIPVEGEVGEWTTVTADVDGASGTHDVFFVFAAPDGLDADTDLVEVDNWAFAALQPTAPTAPQAVAVVSGDASAKVTWQAPASDGHSEITSYRVTATPVVTGGKSKRAVPVVVETTEPAATLSGLRNGVDYTVVVTATNEHGTSEASETVVASPRVARATPATPPSKPRG